MSFHLHFAPAILVTPFLPALTQAWLFHLILAAAQSFQTQGPQRSSPPRGNVPSVGGGTADLNGGAAGIAELILAC